MRLKIGLKNLSRLRISGAGFLSPLASFGRSRFPLVIASMLACSFLLCSFAEGILSSRAMALQEELAAAAARRQPSILYAGGARSSKSATMKFDSFNVPDKNPADEADKTEEPEPDAPPKPIKSFRLVGTLPSVGAWVASDKATEFVLRRQEFNGYALESVEPQMVIFTRDGEIFPLYMVYSAASAKPAAAQPAQRGAQPKEAAPSPQAGQAGREGVMLATFNGDDGTVTRELLNDLLMNPYAELSKMRLIPTESGMRIAAIRSDAMFAKLGMKRGDVITGINGIAITDVGNFANVISSLLTGARLDFQATRDGSQGQLGYAVK
ncbi:MAG: PDZ domain-containing protein [Synergistaceae bacterium]|jgi:type II secretory pathway component PulC|nr:PDZ domain-containing protein [Synergistaceae bacterium]